MDNPLEQPAPEDPMERVHTFARDLTWGAMNGKWTGHIQVFSQSQWRVFLEFGVYDRISRTYDENLREFIEGKWVNNPPECSLLLSFGYFEPDRQHAARTGRGSPTFYLTPKALALLEMPTFSPVDATITYKYMDMAEQLILGLRPDHVHIPAAVLAGIQLEIGLRRLCKRQRPPIETKLEDGRSKRLNSLINELQGKVFKPQKGDQLRSWTKIRNSAGHGEVEDFTRADVEDMITGIKRFLTEYDL